LYNDYDSQAGGNSYFASLAPTLATRRFDFTEELDKLVSKFEMREKENLCFLPL